MALLLIAAMAWQVLAVVQAQRGAASLVKLTRSLGWEPALLSELLVRAAPFLWILPLVTTVLMLDVLRRKRTVAAHPAAVLGLALLTVALLNAWTAEALSAPFRDMIICSG